ncbi:MAG TPA: glycosyltransferase family 2 protein [Hyphomonadaceae bacterium]|nr:glycosyltransferase family 2 protein [Hyphomonadaceae bacterium]
MRARSAVDETALSSHELFQLRLADAQAFGKASEGLAASRPDLSAKSGLTIVQRAIGWTIVIAFSWFLFTATNITLTVAEISVGVLFATIIGLRLFAAIRAARQIPVRKPARVQDNQLPTMTLLIPLLREGLDVVKELVAAIGRLDYPVSKMDVKILVEADDVATINAVLAANPPPWFEIIPVPPGEPRTKPKALNYGLAKARGSIIAVFDAEDRPDPDQPRAAMAAFQAGGSRLAVVQAPLLIHNGKAGWLAQQFEVEYAIHFRVWLPFLAWLKLPLALGGTSNYFRKQALLEAGGWDAWNVTEDADIGLRLARRGHAAQTITPPTYEEAPAKLGSWMKQRTRWMKGHLQTWLVLMRKPFKVVREIGLIRFLGLQLTFGVSLIASVLHLPLFAWIALCVFQLHSFEWWHAALCMIGYAGVVFAALAAKASYARFSTLLTLPLYWPLQSLAMLFAFVEMKFKPHYWAKTHHGAKTPPSLSAPQAEQPRVDNVIQLELAL